MTTTSTRSSSAPQPPATDSASDLPPPVNDPSTSSATHPFAVLPRRVSPSSSSSSSGTAPAPAKPDCPIAEIIQYQCQMHRDEVVCVPLVRLFRQCPRVPAVEITPEYDRLGRPIVPATRSPWIDPDVADVKHRSPMFHKVSQAQGKEQEPTPTSTQGNSGPHRWAGSRTSQDDMDEELEYS